MTGQPDGGTPDYSREVTERLLSLQGEDEIDADFARRLHVSPQTLNAWQTGTKISLDKLIVVAKRARINLLWLMTGQGRPDAPPPDTAEPYTAGVLDAARRMLETVRAMFREATGTMEADSPDPMLREIEERLSSVIARDAAKRSGGRDLSEPGE